MHPTTMSKSPGRCRRRPSSQPCRDFGSGAHADSDGRAPRRDSSRFAARRRRPALRVWSPLTFASALFEVMRSIPGVVVAQDSTRRWRNRGDQHRDDRNSRCWWTLDGGQVVGEKRGLDSTDHPRSDEVPADVRDFLCDRSARSSRAARWSARAASVVRRSSGFSPARSL